jgi:glycerol-3-phosphate dehydrogenase subunit C
MREGSLEAPVRHPLAWTVPEFTDAAAIDTEMRRIFDVCHTCRRCFNLCDSFPRLFDLIDQSKTGELESVESRGFKQVVDACTLCDMCFMTKCPYVPPHEFNVDFPHLMLRYRAAELKRGEVPFADRELTKTDRNARLGGALEAFANWATRRKNKFARAAMERFAHVDRNAELPRFHRKSFVSLAKAQTPAVNREAPAFGRKAVIYATCFANYNNPGIGLAARAVLAKNGVETEVVYPECCGMPQLEHGDLASVARRAKKISKALIPFIEKGHDVVALIPSCALMFKFEWPLVLPGDADVKRLSHATYDITEYVVDIAKNEGLAPGLGPLGRAVTLHMACHARAQNMGQKAAEMLRLVPDADISVIERCSGHGGSWGVLKGNFEVALKIGAPVARHAAMYSMESQGGTPYVTSECPLAGAHIVQSMEKLGAKPEGNSAPHPIELFARAYGIAGAKGAS